VLGSSGAFHQRQEDPLLEPPLSECFNDEALRQGVESERPLLRYAKLIDKQSGNRSEISHWVVSPPQEWAKSMMQTKEEFDDMFQIVIDDLQACGVSAGTTIFHSPSETVLLAARTPLSLSTPTPVFDWYYVI